MGTLKFGVLFTAVFLAVGCSDPSDRIAQHRAAAEGYFENEQWSEARIEFLNLLQVAPEDAEAHYKMAQVQFRLQKHQEGFGQLKEAVRLKPENTAWRLELGRVLAAARSYDSARRHIDAVLSVEPGNVVALLARGGLKSVDDDLDGMLADVDSVLEIEPRNQAALAMKAQALARRGDVAGGEEYWHKLLEVAPTAANYITLARFLAGLERRDEALAPSRQAIDAAESDTERVAAQMNLANLYLNMGDGESTKRVLQEAYQQSPDSFLVVLTLARWYFAAGEPERAEGLLLEHADKSRDSSDALLMLAEYYRASSQPERAIEAVDRALAVTPDSEPAQLQRAEYLYTRGEEDEAARTQAWEIVKTVLGTNPESVEGHFTEGKFYLAEGRYEEAAASLRGVLEAKPSANAHLLLGEAHQKMGKLDLARGEFQRALQLDAQNLQARTSLAALYLQTGDDEFAEREARRAAEASPGDGRSRLVLAGALIRLQRLGQALEALEPLGQGAGLAPVARLDLARLRLQAGDASGASSILEELVELPDLRTRAQALLINIVLRERGPSEAIARLDGWISQAPEQAEMYLLRGRVRLGIVSEGELAQPSEAEADLRAAIDKGLPGIQAHLLMAVLYLRTGSTDTALQTLLEARSISPQDARVPFQLATIYEHLGKTDDAIEAYEAVLRLDPTQPEVKNNLAWLLADAEDPSEEDLERAVQLAQEAARARPGDPRVSDTLGWAMLKKNLPSAAILLFREAIGNLPEGHPLGSTLRYHLAQAYEANGEIDRAIAELTGVLGEGAGSEPLDDQSVQVRVSLASLHLQSGESRLAEREARVAMEARPDEARPRLILAGAMLGLRQPEEALEVLDSLGHGAELSPAARLHLARLRRQAGDSDGARRIASELLGSSELRAPAQAELIDCDLQDRKFEEAIVRLDGWISREPGRAELHLLRGRVRFGLVSAGDLSQAANVQADLEDAIAKGLPGIQAHLLLASLHLHTGENDSALQALVEAGDVAPRDIEVRTRLREAIDSLEQNDPLRGTAGYHLAQAYVRNGEIDKAITELTRALDEVPSFIEREATEQMLRKIGPS